VREHLWTTTIMTNEARILKLVVWGLTVIAAVAGATMAL
jgi:hypothetical protein